MVILGPENLKYSYISPVGIYMKNKKTVLILVPLLVAALSFLPAQTSLAQAAGATKKVDTVTTLKPTEHKKAVKADETAEEEGFSLSTGTMIAIGAGAAVLLGGAIALATDSSDPPPPPTPPTAEQLVSPWHAEGNQPGSGLTYTGTYHLYQGGGLGYDLYVSNGQHLVGGGAWRINHYTLSLHTDHGSLYTGEFAPGNINTVNLNSNTGWNLTLTR